MQNYNSKFKSVRAFDFLLVLGNSHQKTAFKAVLVNLAGMLNGWIDNLGDNIPQLPKIVNLQMGVDLPGVEPGRLGLSIQPSKPARPTPNPLSQILAEKVNNTNENI